MTNTLQVRRGVVEKALAGLLNAASGAEEVRGALVSRIAECAPLRLPAQPTQDPADTCAWTLSKALHCTSVPGIGHKRQARQCWVGYSALASGLAAGNPAAAGVSRSVRSQTAASQRDWACRWVAALKLLVDILRAEHRAALSVWPSEYTAAEPAFNEVVSRSVVAATHAGAFIVASKRMPEKVPTGRPLT